MPRWEGDTIGFTPLGPPAMDHTLGLKITLS